MELSKAWSWKRLDNILHINLNLNERLKNLWRKEEGSVYHFSFQYFIREALSTWRKKSKEHFFKNWLHNLSITWENSRLDNFSLIALWWLLSIRSSEWMLSRISHHFWWLLIISAFVPTQFTLRGIFVRVELLLGHLLCEFCRCLLLQTKTFSNTVKWTVLSQLFERKSSKCYNSSLPSALWPVATTVGVFLYTY